MAKTEESRPRSKRANKEKTTIKEKETFVEEAQAGHSEAAPLPAGSIVIEPDSSDTNTSEILVLPVLPLRGTVVFPLTVVPLAAAQARSLRLIDDVMSGDRTVALVMQKDAELEGAGPDDVYNIGTISTIHQMMRVPDGTVRLAVQGNERMRILEFLQEEPYLMARVQREPEVVEESVEVEALTRNTLELFQRLVSLVAHMPDELVTAALNVDDPRHLVYLVATNLRMDSEERQRLLELDSVRDKLVALELLSLPRSSMCSSSGRRSRATCRKSLARISASIYLREQLKAIQRELGEGTETEAEATELRKKIESSGMPEEAAKEARRELDRLSKLPPAAAEYGVIKTYLDWLTTIALECPHGRRDRRRQGAPNSRRRALRSGKDQGSNSRVSGRAEAEAGGGRRGRGAGTAASRGTDPLLCRSSGGREDEPCPVGRARPWPRADAHVAWWRA